MRQLESSLPRGSRLPALDVALLSWALAWVVVAVLVTLEVRDLGELSDTVGIVAGAVETSAASIALLGDLPVVGEAFGGAAAGPVEEVRDASRAAQESAISSRESVNTLSVLLGLSIALVPTVPLAALYLPARVGRVREARAVEAAARRAGDDPLFREYLARRAAETLPLRSLDGVSEEPWRDLAEGRFDGLARAELERLGVRQRMP